MVFKEEYLITFCKEISDERVIRETSFMSSYELGITHFTPYLESEIIENLLILPNDKKDDYINFVMDKISKTPYASLPENFIDRWLVSYDSDISEFPYFSNKELSDLLNKNYKGYYMDPHEQILIEDIQIDFFCYASMLEVKKMIDFLESKKTNNNSNKEKSSDASTKEKVVPTYNKILKSFEELYEIEGKIAEEEYYDFQHNINSFNNGTPISEKYSFDIMILESGIKTNFEELHKNSLVNNFYYFDCPSKIYINHFNIRKEAFFSDVPDANELDFLLNEIDYLSKPFENRLVGTDTLYNYDKYITYSDKYRISLKRKVEFLSKKIEIYNYKIEYTEDQLLSDVFDKKQCWGTKISAVYDSNINSKKKRLDAPKLSNIIEEKPSKQLTTNQTILLLDSLGFFNLDKIKSASKEKQSKLISKLIGRHFKNIKIAIQNLEKKPSELKKSHQADIDKIDDILNNLE